MTKLNKPVRRSVDGLLRKPITVILFPGGVLGFKEHRSRKTYTLPILTAYKLAINADRLDKLKKKKAKP